MPGIVKVARNRWQARAKRTGNHYGKRCGLLRSSQLFFGVWCPPFFRVPFYSSQNSEQRGQNFFRVSLRKIILSPNLKNKSVPIFPAFSAYSTAAEFYSLPGDAGFVFFCSVRAFEVEVRRVIDEGEEIPGFGELRYKFGD